MIDPQPQAGDTFLFLSFFPCHLLPEELPARAGPGVYLDAIPRALLAQADPAACADYVLPGYNVDSSKFAYCLRSPSSEATALGHRPGLLFFNTLGALRLHDPLHIAVEGWLRLEEGGSVEWGNPYHLRSPWKSDQGGIYWTNDVSSAAEIAERQLELWAIGSRRFLSATIYFLHVTCGFSVSLPMAYLGLFAALEALFAPQGPKGESLGRRAGQFLCGFEDPSGWVVRDWVKHEYDKGRSKLVHGDWDVSPWAESVSTPCQKRLGRLHEITRLCILGFMSLTDGKLQSVGKATRKQLQDQLDGLAPASGRFVNGQYMRCN